MAVRCVLVEVLSKCGRLMPTAAKVNGRQLLPALGCISTYSTATVGATDPLTSKIITEHQRLEELFQQYERTYMSLLLIVHIEVAEGLYSMSCSKGSIVINRCSV